MVINSVLKSFLSSVENPFTQMVSYQSASWAPLNKEITIQDALSKISSEEHKSQILTLRLALNSGNKEIYDSQKKRLPAITFCGTFEGERKRSNLKTYNCLIVLDVDKLTDETLSRVKSSFLSDDNVFAFWDSPSKKGVKGLVKLKYTFDLNNINIDKAHKAAFLKVSKHFLEKHQISIDASGSDTTRLCFLSFDPKLYIKRLVINFIIDESDLISQKESKSVKTKKAKHLSTSDALNCSFRKNEPLDRHTMQSIIRFLDKHKKSITYSYNNWYRVAMAIANTFTYDVGVKYFLAISSIDQAKYVESNCRFFLESCYEAATGEIKFLTLIYLAEEVGYKLKQKEKGTEVMG